MSEFIAVLSGHKKPLEELVEVELILLHKKCEWDGDDLTVTFTPDALIEEHVDLAYITGFFEDVQKNYEDDGQGFTFSIEEVQEVEDV